MRSTELDGGLLTSTIPRTELKSAPERMPLTIHLVALGFCVGIPGSVLSHAAGVESGPLAHQFGLTLSPGRRTEVLGPLLSYERREAQTQ